MSGADSSQARPAGPYFQTYVEGRGAPVRWRLLSGNHRDLGRGVVDHDDLEACRREITALVGRVADADFGLVKAEGHRWGWRLSVHGVVLATSGHSFDRRTRCEQGFALFVQLAPLATVREELAVWPARGRPLRTASGPAVPVRVGPSWSAVHPRSANRSPAPGYLASRTVPPGSSIDSTEASR